MPLVRFEFHAEAETDEHLYIVGAPQALGLWDVDSALQLETSPKSYPWWISQVVDIEAEDSLVLQALLVAENGDVKWELQTPRCLPLLARSKDWPQEGCVRIITMEFGDASQVSERFAWGLGLPSGASVEGFFPNLEHQDQLPSMIVFPGGGYGDVLFEHEGRPIAQWLQAENIAAFVVNYSVQPAQHPTQLREACCAVKWVRHHACSFGLDSARVAVIGCSAGAHLAGLLITAGEDAAPDVDFDMKHCECEWPWLPNLGVLCYPVVTLDHTRGCVHSESRTNLLGPRVDDRSLCKQLSIEHRVTDWTPPIFLWHTWDDDVSPVENAYLLARALSHAGVQHELHVYQHHGICHGASLTGGGQAKLPWVAAVMRWLQEQDFLNEHRSCHI